jgi:hypothetical protein
MQRYACRLCAKGLTASTDADAHEREGRIHGANGRCLRIDSGTDDRDSRARPGDWVPRRRRRYTDAEDSRADATRLVCAYARLSPGAGYGAASAGFKYAASTAGERCTAVRNFSAA